MATKPQVREVDENEAADVSLGQAKAFVNRVIDKVYDCGPENLSISELCQLANSYSLIAQTCLLQQNAEQLKRIADMAEGYLVIYADPAVLNDMGK